MEKVRNMSRRKQNRDSPFQSIAGAAYLTGLSAGFVRKGVRNGSIPHIKVGSDYRVNMPLWLEQLNQQSEGRCNNE